MIKLRKMALWLCVLSFLGNSGAASFCSSCGPKVMDCCTKAPETKQSLSKSPCCDFVIGTPSEPHPARLSVADSRSTPCDEVVFAAPDLALRSDYASRLPPRPEFLDDNSPPIFLRNVALIC